MLRVENVWKTFNAGTVNEKTALAGLNLHLNEGDFVTVIGGNGAGKSTMLNAVAGVWPVDEGKIFIDSVDVTKLPEHKRAAYLGRVFQDPMTGTAAGMQIEENLALAARRGSKRFLKPGITQKEREYYKERLASLGLGLEDRLTSKVGLLSGGQRQALTLLMATLKKPRLLLLDEHTAALDPKTAAKVLDATDRIVGEDQPDHPDDHPQYEGCHRPRQPSDHDVRGPYHLRCGGRGEEKPEGIRPAGQIRGGQRRRVRQRPDDADQLGDEIGKRRFPVEKVDNGCRTW